MRDRLVRYGVGESMTGNHDGMGVAGGAYLAPLLHARLSGWQYALILQKTLAAGWWLMF